MGSFSISFDQSDSADECFFGTVVFGDNEERFQSSATYWSMSDYEAQWKEAIDHIRSGGDRTCFITSMENPKFANFYRTWVLYRIDDERIAIQERILFADRLTTEFDPHRAWDFVGDRITVNDDGDQISELTMEHSLLLDG